MKPAWWMAVFLLALMVGGVTFVMVYIGGGQPPVPKAAKSQVAQRLSFASQKYPEEGLPPAINEARKNGLVDFWFQNDNAQEVPVGLNSKSCQCTQVEVTVLPESWQPRLAAVAASRRFLYLQRPLELLPFDLISLAACQQEVISRDLVSANLPDTQLWMENSVTVPPGALGWVRLLWSGDKLGPRNLHADVWMGHRGSSASAQFDVEIRTTEPIMTEPEISIGTVGASDLEKGKQLYLYCWSLTRRSFQVKAERIKEPGGPQSDPVDVGSPEPMTEAERKRFSQSPPVLCGYRIPVTLRAKAPDGTPFNLGHFQRYLQLTSPEEGIEPLQVTLRGQVQGAIMVGGPKEQGRIVLGAFPSQNGARGDITVSTDVPGLELQLDKERIPEFMKVRFPDKPEVLPTGHRMWVLRVEIPPHAARGPFPRPDDPVFRDSAIYVKTVGDAPRSIRIPVVGTANDG
jgi:hypothetical protein